MRINTCAALLVALVGSLSAGAQALQVNDNHQTVSTDCGGRDVQINGNHNTLKLTGVCHGVQVNGNENTVAINQAALIAAAGNRNTVSWAAGQPKVSNTGTDNLLSGKAGATQTSIRPSTGPRRRTRSGTVISDGSGNTISTDSNGTVIKDSAGNSIVVNQPH